MIRWLKERILNEWFSIIFNPSHFLDWIYIFRWFNIKDEEICDPMEKIWIKKELYFSSYLFLNFLDFFWILFDFYQFYFLI